MMLSIYATFPSSTDSKELYNELSYYNFNVLDAIKETYAYGEIQDKYLSRVNEIMLKFGATEITIS